MRLLIATVSVALALCPAIAAEPYRTTPYFECLVGKGVTQRIWEGATADEAMDYAISNCASTDPGAPTAEQDALDNREYMRLEAYSVIANAASLEQHTTGSAPGSDNTPIEIGLGN